VRHLHAGIRSHRLQRTDLIGDQQLELLRIHVDAATAEAPDVVEARMRADAHPVVLRLMHDPVHHIRVARVEPAGDARGIDDLENLGVVADLVGAEPLAHVGVEIESLGHGLSPEKRGLQAPPPLIMVNLTKISKTIP